MKFLPKLKPNAKLFIALAFVLLFSAAAFLRVENSKYKKELFLISEMEVDLLQSRRAEKNFLMRHDLVSVANFAKEIKAFKSQSARMKSQIKDRIVLGLFDEMNAQMTIYENAFQDIKGLCDTDTFGPVHDQALSKITDHRTLIAEPGVTPSSVDTTMSVIEAGRNLEYYINTLVKSPTPLISILQARRWEKNFHKRYDILTGVEDSKSVSYLRKIEKETTKIEEWLESEDMMGESEQVIALLKKALLQYQLNLRQFAQNLDASYIKKKEMIRAARNMEQTFQMIKGKMSKTVPETDIGGIYYLSPKLPVHGQPVGNNHDVGSLLATPPFDYGYRHCKNWMQFYFDHDGSYNEENLISSIYFHLWIRTVKNSIDVGYEREGKYSGGRGGMDDFISIKYDNSKGYSTRNGCSLITGKIDTDSLFEAEDIYKFAIKLSRHSGYPSVVMEPNQYSFIIINPPCDRILKSIDNDNDGINDYEEMFVCYTNPYDGDTDNDGFSDETEVVKGTSPNLNDLYSGGIIEGVNDTPYIDHYKEIKGDWIVDNKEEKYKSTKFTLHGNLLIRNGGCLTLENSILEMNRKNRAMRIYVEKGSALKVKNTKIDFNETGYWYKIVEERKVATASDFNIYGTLNMRECVIQNGLGIKIYDGSETVISGSNILNCYHLSYEGESNSKIESSVISTFIGISIYCKSASPFIKDTVLSVEYSGVGIYCFRSSPSIDNSKIIVCEDEDSDSSALILVAESHPAISNTQFNNNRVNLDKSSSIVFE